MQSLINYKLIRYTLKSGVQIEMLVNNDVEVGKDFILEGFEATPWLKVKKLTINPSELAATETIMEPCVLFSDAMEMPDE